MNWNGAMNRVRKRVGASRVAPFLLVVCLLIGLPKYAMGQEKAELFVRIEKALKNSRRWKIETLDFDTVSTPPIDKISLRSGNTYTQIDVVILERIQYAHEMFEALHNSEPAKKRSIPDFGDENRTWGDSRFGSLVFRRGRVVVRMSGPTEAMMRFARLILTEAGNAGTQ
jgi:hypothetical protein